VETRRMEARISDSCWLKAFEKQKLGKALSVWHKHELTSISRPRTSRRTAMACMSLPDIGLR
jgi:hypothetical protein